MNKFEIELARAAETEDVIPLGAMQSLASNAGIPSDKLEFALRYVHSLGIAYFPKLTVNQVRSLRNNNQDSSDSSETLATRFGSFAVLNTDWYFALLAFIRLEMRSREIEAASMETSCISLKEIIQLWHANGIDVAFAPVMFDLFHALGIMTDLSEIREASHLQIPEKEYPYLLSFLNLLLIDVTFMLGLP